MSVVNIKITSRLSPNASYEEQKRNLDKMMKMFRTLYSETGGVKDQIDKYERYCKPSEKRRQRDKIERNRAQHKQKDRL
jgi:hypothetical protein